MYTFNVNEHEVLAQIDAAKNLKELRAICIDFAASLGCMNYAFALRVHTSLSKSRSTVHTNYSMKWAQVYIQRHFDAIDPIVKACNQTCRPVIWNELPKDDDANKFFESSRAHDLVDGISVATIDHRGRFSIFSIAKDKALPQNKSILGEMIRWVQWVAPYIHERSAELFKIEAMEATEALTQRERTCLRWAAEGKTAWEIAQILGISERTVVFHLQNASSKLGTTGRQHAIAIAIARGDLSYEYDEGSESVELLT